MVGMEAILEPLVRSPKFISYVDELNGFLRREAEARQRFRESLNEDVRAEFINGEVIVHMTARHARNITVRHICRLLDTFVESRRLGLVLQEQALTSFQRNDYAPDICYWDAEKASKFSGDMTVYPVPDLIVEVLSASTQRFDRGVKFEDYAAHGVRELWFADPDSHTIEQYVSRQGRFEAIGKISADETLRSSAIVGLEMPVKAAFDDQANQAFRAQIAAG
jgi:Uma2 family endonuclease